MCDNPIKEELQSILHDVAKSQKIKNYETIVDLNMSSGDGFIGQFYTGKVKNKNSGEVLEVAIKKLPPNLDFGVIFKNEDLFYSTIMPSLNSIQRKTGTSESFDNIPKYFCGSWESKKEYIAMENLKTLGYTLHDKATVLNEEHLELIFKIYGKFHALSFVLKKENPKEYKEVLKDVTDFYKVFLEYDSVIEIMRVSYEAAVAALQSEAEKDICEKARKFIGNNLKETFIHAAQYNGEYSCITHGDCWSNNMLFKYQDNGQLENMKLIDFQLCRDGTPIHDLSYFFYSGASKKDLDALDKYLDIYHESFSHVAKELGCDADDIFPLEVLKSEWKQFAQLGVLMGIYLWNVKLFSKEQIIEFMGDEEVLMEEKIKNMAKATEKTLKSDEFLERTKSILIHAVEYGVL